MRIVSQHLELSGIDNCRDLGGIPTTDGRHVKDGLLVRSANLHHASHDDLETLDRRGVRHVVDLRSRPERRLKRDRLLPGWTVAELPTFREAKELKIQLRDLVTRPGTFIEDLYPHLVLDQAAVDCWTAFFRLLVDDQGGTLFHCTQGKDRTGVAAALVLAALGVDEALIRDDYLQTNLYMGKEIPDFVEEMEPHLGERMDADIDEFLVAAPLYFDTYLDATSSFGGPVGYLQERCAVSDDDLATLRETYLE